MNAEDTEKVVNKHADGLEAVAGACEMLDKGLAKLLRDTALMLRIQQLTITTLRRRLELSEGAPREEGK